MTTPVTSSSTTTVTPAITQHSTTTVPIGVGAQPTTISSSVTVSDAGYWDSVKTNFSSFAEFIRDLVVKALETLSSGIGTVAGWMGSKPGDASTQGWQLSPETNSVTLNAVTEQNPFSALPITDAERQKIYVIVHTMGISQGMTGWMNLLKEKNTLEKLGQEINHVHPFKFLEYVLKHDILKKDLDSLSQGALTWRPFVQGIGEKMRRESVTLASCRSGFARSLNLNLSDIDPFLTAADWEGFVKFLIDIKSGRKTSVWVEPAQPSLPAESTSSAVSTSTTTTTMAAPTPPALTSSVAVHLANLPFETGDAEILNSLVSRYAETSRWRLLWEQSQLHLQWTHIGVRHPLRLLAYLYSKPALMNHVGTIFQYYGTKTLFLRGLTEQLRKTAFSDVRPYIDDFSQACSLDPNRIQQSIQTGQWEQVVEDLHHSHLARPNT